MKKIVSIIMALTIAVFALSACNSHSVLKHNAYAPSTLAGKAIVFKYPKGSLSKSTALYARGEFTKNRVTFYPVAGKKPHKIAKNSGYYTYKSRGNSAVLKYTPILRSGISNIKAKTTMTFSGSKYGSFYAMNYNKKQGKWVQGHKEFGKFWIK